jgi:hypothetical protein
VVVGVVPAGGVVAPHATPRVTTLAMMRMRMTADGRRAATRRST